jgi:hypothetical protein
VPGRWLKDPWGWPGWTAGLVRQAVRQIAQEFEADPDELLVKAAASREQWEQEACEEIKRLEKEVRSLERGKERRLAWKVQKSILPDQDTLDKIMRYEAHLGRQLMQAMHMLERLQKVRAGESVPAPAALDVTVAADGDAGRGAGGEFVRQLEGGAG